MMNDLDKELQNLGFSKDYIIAINEAERFNKYDINVDNISYQSYDNEMISSAELEVTQAPSTCANFLIESCD